MNSRNEDATRTQPEPDPGTYAHMIYLADFLREGMIRRAIESLRLPTGSRGLDAGCGIGSHCPLLAEAVGPGGHVMGLDLSADFVARARDSAAELGLSDRVSYREGDIDRLPLKDNAFDWAWSVDCVAYHPAGLRMLREVARVVKPGGTVALLAWSSQQLLPGYPLLEAHLNATSLGTAPFTPGMKPEQHFLRALGWFHQLGFRQPGARTFVGDVHAPLSELHRQAVLSLFDMRWGEPASELSADDWALYQRLRRPGSPDFILDLPDYYAFFIYSMFYGTVPG